MSMDYSEEDSLYLKSRVHPILDRLTEDIVISKPKDVVNFMVEWLLKNAGISLNFYSHQRRFQLSCYCKAHEKLLGAKGIF
jgi:hypothetical protein